MNKVIKILILNFLYLTLNCLAQQQNLFTHFTIEDGLSQSSVYSIVQDDIGFMWFATEDGLNKFDGNKFIVYRPKPRDSTSISDLGIRKVYKDKSGNIWIITLNGNLNLYNSQKDNFKKFLFFNKNKKELNIISLTEDIYGVLWVATTKSEFFYYDSGNKKFIQKFFNENISKQLESIHLQCLIGAKDGTLWIGSWEGLININPKISEFIWYKKSNKTSNSLGGDMVFSLAEDDDGNIWAASADGGISVFLKSTRTFKIYKDNPNKNNSISSNRIMSILIDSRKKIWIGTLDKGLDLFDSQTKIFTNFSHDPSSISSISIGAIMSIYEDKSGGVWFGTLGGGLNRYDPLNQNFFHIQNIPGKHNSISPNPVLAICEDYLGNLWIGSDGGGINYKAKNSDKFKSYLQNPSLGSNTISVIYEDSKGNIWIATDPGAESPHGILLKYNRGEDSFIPINEVKIKLGGISVIKEDKFGELWIATPSDGVHRYNPITKKEVVYKFDSKDSSSISSNSIFSICEDSFGNIWFGSFASGLNLFDRKSNSFKRFVNDPKDNSSIGSNAIWCIVEDHNKDLWIGTWGGGINKYDRNKNNFVRYTSEDGLSGNIVYSILPDDDGNLWFSSNKGLLKFDIKNSRFHNYNRSDGLLINDFSAGASFKSKDGYLYFGGNSGVVFFNPKNIKENNFIPNVVITDFKIFNKSLVLDSSILFTKEIHLDYDQNFFTIEFASLDFTSPTKNQFEYKLEGVDKNWIKADGNGFANYTDISNGKYKFRVKGSNSSGKFNPKEIELGIIIAPPFWKTWWFRLFVFLLLVLILYAFHKYRLNKLLEVERTRIRIASDLHDDVSATITGLVYFSDAIEKEIGDMKTPMLQKLISLIHESSTSAQESISDIIWSINPENDKWEIILPKFRRFASDLCESKGIKYKIEIPEVIPIKLFDMERRRNFWLIFKEMVTNAVKHSQCLNLEINIFLTDNKLNLIVSDDGKGFNLEKIKNGNGVKNIQLRSKNLNGEIKLETSPEIGTKWTLSIPV